MAEFGYVYGRFLAPDDSERPLSGRVEFTPDSARQADNVDYPVSTVVAELDERGNLSRVGSSKVGVGLLPGVWCARFFLRDRWEHLTYKPLSFTLNVGDEKWFTQATPDGPSGGEFSVTDVGDGTAVLNGNNIVDNGDGTATIQIG